MTREEAIDMVKHILKMIPKEPPTECDYVEEWFYEDNQIRKALNMAIKALEQEQEPCEDAVSRAEVIKIAKEMYLEVANMNLDVKTISDCISYTSSKCREVLERKLQALSSVTPQEPRKGHWEVVSDGYSDNAYICECSECKDTVWIYKDADRKWNYCPNCGADMREVKE